MGPVNSVAFSHDGKRVVSGSRDTTVWIWDTDAGWTVPGSFEGHTHPVTSVAFSHDGKRVVSGPYDSTVRTWDSDADQRVSSLSDGHIASDGFALFSSDVQRVIPPLSGHLPATNSAPFAFHDAENTRMFTNQSSLDDDGWILGPNSELLSWVPPQNRVGLWRPNTTAVMGRSSTKIDFSRFLHGVGWTQGKG